MNFAFLDNVFYVPQVAERFARVERASMSDDDDENCPETIRNKKFLQALLDEMENGDEEKDNVRYLKGIEHFCAGREKERVITEAAMRYLGAWSERLHAEKNAVSAAL